MYAARYRHLTTREHNRPKPTQAQTVVAAAILRPLYAVTYLEGPTEFTAFRAVFLEIPNARAITAIRHPSAR